MRKLLMIFGVLGLCLAMAGGAGATFILDTGPNPSTSYFYALGSGQWLAGEFTTTQAWQVGAMQGYILGINAGEVDVGIYTNQSGLPGTPLFTKPFQGNYTGLNYAWQGSTGYAGNLAAGTYWIAFTVPTSSAFSGGMGYTPPPSPMSPEAYHLTSTGMWKNYELDLGARIEAVPVPGAIWLLGSGLLGLAGWRRFRKG